MKAQKKVMSAAVANAFSNRIIRLHALSTEMKEIKAEIIAFAKEWGAQAILPVAVALGEIYGVECYLSSPEDITVTGGGFSREGKQGNAARTWYLSNVRPYMTGGVAAGGKKASSNKRNVVDRAVTGIKKLKKEGLRKEQAYAAIELAYAAKD
jgi:hypothetical protein